MFSCVGGFINLILHCRTTARADTASLHGWGFLSVCVARLCLTCKSTLLPEPIKMCGWKRGGMRRGREGRREGRGERRGEKGRKPSLASFCLPPCLASPGFQSILHNQQFLPILRFPFNSFSLHGPPLDDSTSAILLCPSSCWNLNRDTKFLGRGRRQTSPPRVPPPAKACHRSKGLSTPRVGVKAFTTHSPFLQSQGLQPIYMISICTREPMCLCTPRNPQKSR